MVVQVKQLHTGTTAQPRNLYEQVTKLGFR